MPLAEHASLIAISSENVAHSYLVLTKQGASHDGVPDAGAVAVATSHNASPGWRAGRTYMEIRQTNAFVMEIIKIWGLDDGIAVTSQVAVALIISYDEDHTGPPVFLGIVAW
jgi:hypothetical protein